MDFLRPACLVLRTPRISTAERHEVTVVLVVSALKFSLYVLFALHSDPFSSTSEELFDPVCEIEMVITASVILLPYVLLYTDYVPVYITPKHQNELPLYFLILSAMDAE